MGNNEKAYLLDGSYCSFYGAYAKIYTLSDAGGNVFYVGCTVRELEDRLTAHLTEARVDSKKANPAKNKLIRSLDYNVVIKVVDMQWVTALRPGIATHKAKDLEDSWIKKFMDLGYELCNRHIKKQMVGKKNFSQPFVGQTFRTRLTDSKEIEIVEVPRGNGATK